MEENLEENNKFNTSLLSFDDSDKNLMKVSKGENINNTNKLIDEKNKVSINIDKKKISLNSKIRLWASILLIIFSLIFIPFFSVSESYLITLEKSKLVDSLKNIISYETLNSTSLKNVYKFFRLLLNKDFLSGYLCFLYIVFHPFVSMKVIYGLNISYCIIVFMQILYQSRRPSWDINIAEKNNQMIICESTFSNPSISLFNFIFCSVYSLYSYINFYVNPQNRLNIIARIVILVIFIILLMIEMILLIIYRLHYLHELVFTICLAFIWICILIGYENQLKKIIINATKNYFKLRKNKLKIFLYVFFELLGGITIFNLIGNDFSSYQIEDNIMKSDSCSKMQKEELSLSNSFMNLSFIFCLLGEFWGASLALEYKPKEWWYQNEKYYYSKINNKLIKKKDKLDCRLLLKLILKGILTIIIFLCIYLVFSLIPFINLVFNFTIQCVKYFTLFFVCTGILPIIFDLVGLNKKDYNSSKRLDEILNDVNTSNLFSPSLFVKYLDISGNSTDNVRNNQLLSYADLNDEIEENDEEKENNIKNN